MDTVTYKNENVASIAAALEKSKPDFEAKKAGQQWRAIIMTVATTFPEDRDALLALFGRPAVVKKDEGTPTLHRNRKKSYRAQSGCKDCPDSPGTDTGLQSGPMRVIKNGKEVTEGKEAAAHESPQEAFSSVEAVLDRFDNDVAIMTTYASAQGIDIGNATTAEGIAKKIVNHYNPAK